MGTQTGSLFKWTFQGLHSPLHVSLDDYGWRQGADFLSKIIPSFKVSHWGNARNWYRWHSLAQSWQHYCHWTHTHSCSFVLIVAHSEASSSFNGVNCYSWLCKLASGDLTKISKIVVGCCAKYGQTFRLDFAIHLLYTYISSRLAYRIALLYRHMTAWYHVNSL